jgi:transcriptional regulator with XRE-family HTH domain
MMNIGERLKLARNQQNISMNKLAKLADISQSTLSRIEAGTQIPTFDVVERCIDALGYSLADFFTNQSPEIQPEVHALMKKIMRLSSRQLKILDSVLDEWKVEENQ